LLFQRAMNCRSGRVRAALLSAFSLALFCVLLTFSRGSWLAGVVVLLGLILLYPRATIRLTIILAAPALFVGSSVLANEVAWAWERLNAEGTAQGRIILFNTGIRMAEARPLFGWGYGDYDRYDDQFKTRVADIPVRVDSTSHNTYLTLITELGLVAFLFYTLPLAYWMVASVKVWQRLPRLGFWSQRLLGMLWLVMIAHIIVSNFMDMIRFNQFGTSVWWIVLGFIANIAYPLLVSGDIAAPRRARKPVENT
jgi:O-antigen ligase